MKAQEKDRIECAIRHIESSLDVDPWARNIAVDAMKKQIPKELVAECDGYAEATKCSTCAAEHRQLAEWLKELKERREKDVSDINVGDMVSKQVAIDALKEERNSAKEWYEEASTSGDKMMLSRAESAMMTFVECILTIKNLPSAQPEIIRCKDCEYGEQDDIGRWFCNDLGCQMGNEDGSGYCANAERRTDEQN